MAINIVYTNTQTSKPPAGGFAAALTVYDATAIVATDYTVFNVGFNPRYVRFENITDRVGIEWFKGMAANSCLKTVAAGTRTLEVTGGNGGITICDPDGTANANGQCFKVLQDATLAAIKASKSCNWVAFA